ncbi:unnamed protein product [Effrenium voratum]|uniref:Phospholipid/glycerol acyltransferase domain-containing protein n=1 Tax=Effrenium voratum TaxID=2562239 RepID=A0AA36N2Q5_9DINO|nr:unnamed protein product [Effrenium voratum]
MVVPKALGQCAFGICLVCSLFPAWLVAVVAKLISFCLPGDRRAAFERILGRLLIVLVVLCWRLLFLLCAWVRIDVFQQEGDGPFLGEPGKPAVLVMNHTSFLDAVLAPSLAPLCRSPDVRVLVANYVFDIPLLSSVMRGIGLPEVPFKGSAGDFGNMAVEKELMDVRLQAFCDHVKSGGVGAWFPEGLRNRGNPEVLQEFRAGAFAVPAQADVEIWCCAAVGCNVSWPLKALMGGCPARIGLKVFRLTDSSHAWLASQNLNSADERTKAVRLAGLAKDAMQEAIHELVAKGFSAKGAASSASVACEACDAVLHRSNRIDVQGLSAPTLA